jgi:hypothetical protein
MTPDCEDFPRRHEKRGARLGTGSSAKKNPRTVSSPGGLPTCWSQTSKCILALLRNSVNETPHHFVSFGVILKTQPILIESSQTLRLPCEVI